ncbi:family 4B encapsulin nanocompartment shell protein [Thermococcus sp.]
MNDVSEILKKAIQELKGEGLNPDLLLVGPRFLEYSAPVLKEHASTLKIYKIDELGFDAVVADSSFFGQIRRASRRISVEPLFREKEMWEELQKLDV